MAVDSANQPTPQKKKLKQAQLPFCIVTPKANKRKLSAGAGDAVEETPVKVLCQQSASNTLKNVLTEKEGNLDVNSPFKVPSTGFCERASSDNVNKTVAGDDIAEGEELKVEASDESEMNVTVSSDAQNSGGDRSLDCSLTLVVSSSEPETDEVPNELSSAETQKSKETSDLVVKPRKRKRNSVKSVERERLKKEKELERERRKDEKNRLKQEKENARKKEKEDKEQKRLAEIRAKEEEKKKKEEAKEEFRRQKDLEKRKKEEAKEEEKRKKEEEKLAQERKENFAKEAFSKFFKRARTSEAESEKAQPEKQLAQKFMPFPVKHDMKLAVVRRVEFAQEAKDRLTSFLEFPVKDSSGLYLTELKNGVRKPGKSEATWPNSDEVHDVIIIESVKDETEVETTVEVPAKKKQSFRAKLFQFHENRRPPYRGTWRKMSNSVSARKPFGKEKILDYEVDSDSEWEDEGEGEDLEKENESDNEKEQSDDENVGENGYLIDNSVFVPHGYLSDEEAEDEDNCDPESQKLRMTALKREFDEEMKQSTRRLQPKVLGCVWISNEATEVSKGSLYEVLMNHRCIWNEENGPIDLSGPVVVDTPPTPQTTPKIKFPESMIEPLVKMVHGSEISHIALVKEFMSFLEKEEANPTVSKRAVSLKIKDIAVKTSSANGPAWQVSADLCAKFGLPFVVEKKVEEVRPAIPEPVTPRGVAPLTNFFKKVETPPKEDPLNKHPEVKKRVPLISLPRGDEIKENKSVSSESAPLSSVEQFHQEAAPVNSESVSPLGVAPLTNYFKKIPAEAPSETPLTKPPEVKKRVPLISLPRGDEIKEKKCVSSESAPLSSVKQFRQEAPSANPEPGTPRGVAPLTNYFKKIPADAPAPPKDPLAKHPEMKKRVLLISLPRCDEVKQKKSVSSESAPLSTINQSIPVETETAPDDKPRDVPTPDASLPRAPAAESNSTPTPVPTPASLCSSSSSSSTPKQKKRITPITLSRSPSTPSGQQPALVHKDTPRPIHTFFKASQKD